MIFIYSIVQYIDAGTPLVSLHEVPVQSLLLHLRHQVLEAPLEENLKAQVVLDHHRHFEPPIDNLQEDDWRGGTARRTGDAEGYGSRAERPAYLLPDRVV